MKEIIRTYEKNIEDKFFPEQLSVLREYRESLVALNKIHIKFHNGVDFSPEKKQLFVKKLQNSKYQKVHRK